MSTKTNFPADSKIPVLVIFAPTASGKTALTRELFSPQGSHFILNAEVVSADSQAVYKGLDIGTAKPDESFCRQIPHHLINLLTPEVQFNVSDFVDLADSACAEIYSKGKLPVVAGGTGFYIRNFLYGVAKTPVSDEKLRARLKERIEKEGNQALYDELKKIDPESAAKIHLNDSYRICRALEVFYLSGKTRSSFKITPKLREKYDFLFLVLEPEREVLYQKIRERVDLMFQAGLEKEVNELKKSGCTKETPAMKAIGYSEFFDYNDIEKIREEIKHHSCKYAKKQYTYIRDIPSSTIIDFSGSDKELSDIAAFVKKWCAKYFD